MDLLTSSRSVAIFAQTLRSLTTYLEHAVTVVVAAMDIGQFFTQALAVVDQAIGQTQLQLYQQVCI